MISIRMLKLCGKSIYKPLDLIFESCMKQVSIKKEISRFYKTIDLFLYFPFVENVLSIKYTTMTLFSVINDKDLSANKLNQDLNRISYFKKKKCFNPNPSKQAQEDIFSRNLQKSTHPPLSFNNNTVTQLVSQKHLGMLLSTKLDFQERLRNILDKIHKITGLLGNSI